LPIFLRFYRKIKYIVLLIWLTFGVGITKIENHTEITAKNIMNELKILKFVRRICKFSQFTF
jgi:hypothetical protein